MEIPDTLLTIFTILNITDVNLADIAVCISCIVACSALYLTTKSIRIQSFESHFETIVTLFVSQWERIEKYAINNTCLRTGNNWSADFKYLDYFLMHIFQEDIRNVYHYHENPKEMTQESPMYFNLIFLDEFVMQFHQFGATFLHLYAMLANSHLAKEEKIEREKTISNLLNIYQRRLLYFWCVLSNKESDPEFIILGKVQNADETKGFFYPTQLWLKEKSCEKRLLEWKKKLLEKQKNNTPL